MKRIQGGAPLTKADLEAVLGLFRTEILDKFGGLERRFDGLEGRFDGLEKRFAKQEERFNTQENRFNGLAGELVRTNMLMREMEERLIKRMDVKFGEFSGRFDDFSRQLGTFYRESHTLPKTLDEHGQTLRDHERRIRGLESGSGKTP